MKTITVKIIIAMLAIFLVITVASQTYLMLNVDYKTETAYTYSSNEMLSFDGVFVRNESVIEYDGVGAVSFSVADGEKVNKDSICASVYSNKSEIDINSQIDELNKELAIINKIKNPGTTEGVNASMLSSQITETQRKIALATENKEYTMVAKYKDELLVQMSAMQIITGDVVDYSGKISTINAKISELEAKKFGSVASIVSPESGYFVSSVDGYESEISLEKIGSMDAEKIENIIANPQKNTGNAIGKVINSFDWAIVGVIDNSSKMFHLDDEITIKTNGLQKEIPAIVRDIRDTSDSTKSVIVISCDRMISSCARNRVERIEIIKNTYTGLKVPESAIRFKDIEKVEETDEESEETQITTENCRGVYVKIGENITFKKIDIIYEGDGYVISRKTSDKSYLALYDDIILEGVDAYAQ